MFDTESSRWGLRMTVESLNEDATWSEALDELGATMDLVAGESATPNDAANFAMVIRNSGGIEALNALIGHSDVNAQQTALLLLARLTSAVFDPVGSRKANELLRKNDGLLNVAPHLFSNLIVAVEAALHIVRNMLALAETNSSIEQAQKELLPVVAKLKEVGAIGRLRELTRANHPAIASIAAECLRLLMQSVNQASSTVRVVQAVIRLQAAGRRRKARMHLAERKKAAEKEAGAAYIQSQVSAALNDADSESEEGVAVVTTDKQDTGAATAEHVAATAAVEEAKGAEQTKAAKKAEVDAEAKAAEEAAEAAKSKAALEAKAAKASADAKAAEAAKAAAESKAAEELARAAAEERALSEAKAAEEAKAAADAKSAQEAAAAKAAMEAKEAEAASRVAAEAKAASDAKSAQEAAAAKAAMEAKEAEHAKAAEARVAAEAKAAADATAAAEAKAAAETQAAAEAKAAEEAANMTTEEWKGRSAARDLLVNFLRRYHRAATMANMIAAAADMAKAEEKRKLEAERARAKAEEDARLAAQAAKKGLGSSSTAGYPTRLRSRADQALHARAEAKSCVEAAAAAEGEVKRTKRVEEAAKRRTMDAKDPEAAAAELAKASDALASAVDIHRQRKRDADDAEERAIEADAAAMAEMQEAAAAEAEREVKAAADRRAKADARHKAQQAQHARQEQQVEQMEKQLEESRRKDEARLKVKADAMAKSQARSKAKAEAQRVAEEEAARAAKEAQRAAAEREARLAEAMRLAEAELMSSKIDEQVEESQQMVEEADGEGTATRRDLLSSSSLERQEKRSPSKSRPAPATRTGASVVPEPTKNKLVESLRARQEAVDGYFVPGPGAFFMPAHQAEPLWKTASDAVSAPVRRPGTADAHLRNAARNDRLRERERPWATPPSPLLGILPPPIRLLLPSRLVKMRSELERSYETDLRQTEAKDKELARINAVRSMQLRTRGHEAVLRRDAKKQQRVDRMTNGSLLAREGALNEQALSRARSATHGALVSTARRPILRTYLVGPAQEDYIRGETMLLQPAGGGPSLAGAHAASAPKLGHRPSSAPALPLAHSATSSTLHIQSFYAFSTT